MSKQSLRALLPPRLSTSRLTLELFDGSSAHYDALLAAMNSPSAHARMGDFGIRTHAQFDQLNGGTRLRPETLGYDGSKIDVDVDVYYLPRVKKEAGPDGPEGPLIGGVSIAQRGAALPPDVGWCILESHHGHGYAAEAARALLECAREVLHITEVMTWPGEMNLPSVRTAEKAGFVRGGVVSEASGAQHVVYVLPDMDFERMRGATISLFGEDVPSSTS